jgi:hypothetical protein
MRWMPNHPDADSEGYVLAHVVVAEEALGRFLPVGVVVHHFDDNAANNANTNLVICEDQKYHMLLHVRQRVLAAGGSPDTDKICSTCQTPKAMATEFTGNASAWDGLHPECKRCKYTREAARQKRKRAERTAAMAA